MTNVHRLKKDDPTSYIVMLMYREAKRHPRDGQWRMYEATIEYQGRKYRITADFILRQEVFSYKKLSVVALERDRITLN